MTASLAISALQRFIQKPTPDNIAPPKPGDEKMGDGLFKPGVLDNQSAVVQWLSEDSGIGLVPEEALTKPVEFEGILDFFRKHEGYHLAKSISSDSPTPAQEHQLQSFLDDTDVRVVLGLCGLEDLTAFISDFGCDLQRELLLNAGYYEEAQSLDGWESFVNQPYTGSDIDGPVPISNGDAYELCQRFEQEGLIGNSPTIVRRYLSIAQIARSALLPLPAPIVLIQGSHGSGKGVFAKTLYTLSKRPGPFRQINVSALSPELVGSELYGHVKGAFTGALSERKGYFEECKSGGMVVLDDINHMQRDQLYKFLQCFEERTITKIGSNDPIAIPDCMTAVTANQDLRTLPDFPSDVLERMSGHVVRLPDIVDRQSDLPLLVRHFMGNIKSNPMSPFRFQIARKIQRWANELPQLSIRSIRNEIEGLQRDSQKIDVVLTGKDRYQLELEAVIKKLYPNAEMPIEAKKAKVAKELGFSRSRLSEASGPYGKAWQRLIEDGTIIE